MEIPTTAEMDAITYPVRIVKITRAYHASERIPWENSGVVATCHTLPGLVRRWQEEKRRVSDGQGGWSGHIRATDAAGRGLYMDDIARDYTVLRDAAALERVHA